MSCMGQGGAVGMEAWASAPWVVEASLVLHQPGPGSATLPQSLSYRCVTLVSLFAAEEQLCLPAVAVVAWFLPNVN